MKKIIGSLTLLLLLASGIAHLLSTNKSTTEARAERSAPTSPPVAAESDAQSQTAPTAAAKETSAEAQNHDPLLWQEVPEGVASQRLVRKAYITSYNQETKQANWVAWCLTREHCKGSIDRKITNFHEDTDVPKPRATHYDYRHSGWSRGHLCPAGDNKWDETAMRESFLMTNMSPQHQVLNGGTWNSIEQESRTWARRYGRVYIVTGPLFLKQDHIYIGENKIPVPEAFWKVVLRLGDRPAAIGFICRNSQEKGRKNEYVNTAAQIERITKIKLFPQLDPKVKAKIWHEAKLEDW